MAARQPQTPNEKAEFKLPAIPPPLHTRDSNDYYNGPATPGNATLTSPQQTPQGSPSKSQMPPGAFDLPNVFDNAMRLIPTAGNGSRTGRAQQAGTPPSPNKGGIPIAEDPFADHTVLETPADTPGSPTRKWNKENTPPGPRPGLPKDSSYINHAAASRQEVYKTRDQIDTGRHKYTSQQNLSQEDLEKLQKPSVKRLANVTQLCKTMILFARVVFFAYQRRRFSRSLL